MSGSLRNIKYINTKRLYQLLLLSLVFFCLFYYVPVSINSTSMLPSLKPEQTLLMKRWYVNEANRLKRGELVLFDHYLKPSVLKRVIGLPGDVIFYHKKTLFIKKPCAITPCSFTEVENQKRSHGIEKDGGYPLTVFDNEIDNTRFAIAITDIVPQNEDNFFKQKGMPIGQWLVPADNVFVMGDNRDNSMDSRYIGFIDVDAISAHL